MSARLVRMAFAARIWCREWETSTEYQAQEQVLEKVTYECGKQCLDFLSGRPPAYCHFVKM